MWSSLKVILCPLQNWEWWNSQFNMSGCRNNLDTCGCNSCKDVTEERKLISKCQAALKKWQKTKVYTKTLMAGNSIEPSKGICHEEWLKNVAVTEHKCCRKWQSNFLHTFHLLFGNFSWGPHFLPCFFRVFFLWTHVYNACQAWGFTWGPYWGHTGFPFITGSQLWPCVAQELPLTIPTFVSRGFRRSKGLSIPRTLDWFVLPF